MKKYYRIRDNNLIERIIEYNGEKNKTIVYSSGNQRLLDIYLGERYRESLPENNFMNQLQVWSWLMQGGVIGLKTESDSTYFHIFDNTLKVTYLCSSNLYDSTENFLDYPKFYKTKIPKI